MNNEQQGQFADRKLNDIQDGHKCIENESGFVQDDKTVPGASEYMETILPEQLNPELVRKLPLEFLKNQCAIPVVLEDGQIAIALADALNIEAYDAILNILAGAQETIKGLWKPDRQCARIICPASEIEKAISRCYYHQSAS